MSEEIDDPTGDPPVPQPAAKPKAPAPKSDPPDPDDMDAEELRAALRKIQKAHKEANAEAQKGREAKRRLQELEEEREKLEQEKLSASEKISRRLAEAEAKAKEAEERAAKLATENRQMRFDNEVRHELKIQGVERPGTIEVCVKALRGDPAIEEDPETDKILGVNTAVSKLIKANPEFVTGMSRGNGTPRREQEAFRVPARGTGAPATVQVDQSEIDRMALANELGYQF